MKNIFAEDDNYTAPVTPVPNLCDTMSQDSKIIDAVDTLIEKLRDMEDLVAMMQSAQRNGDRVEFAPLARRIKWCKDDCALLKRRLT